MMGIASPRDDEIINDSPCWFPKGLFEMPQNYNSIPPLSLSDASSSSSFSEGEQNVFCGENPWLLAMGRTLEIEDFMLLDETRKFLDEDNTSCWGSSISGSEMRRRQQSPKVYKRKISKSKPLARSFLHKKSLLKQDENTLLSEPCRHINFLNAAEHHESHGAKTACPYCRRYLFNRAAFLKNKLPNYSSIEQKIEHEKQLHVEDIISQGEVTSVLLDGWIMKQGDDWLGNRTWKPRFARLTLMKLPKYHVEVPVLHTYWYEMSMTPSSSFILDSATLELEQALIKDNIKGGAISPLSSSFFDVIICESIRRRFAAPEDQIEEWIYAITLAMASYKQLKRRILPVSSNPRRSLMLMDEMRWEPGNFLFKNTYI